MDASGNEDGTDFRPFFDMIIGVLFVLLILVAAQIYFQQAQADTVASDSAKREAALRRADIAAFLDALSARLRAIGLTATVDIANDAVLLPLREVVGINAGGLPIVDDAHTGELGTAIVGLTGCVTVPRNADPACPAYERLGLDALVITTRVGALPQGAALPQDRFGDLGSALLSAKLMSGDTALVRASNAAGERVVTFSTATTGAPSPAPFDPGIGGDLVLDFNFR